MEKLSEEPRGDKGERSKESYQEEIIKLKRMIDETTQMALSAWLRYGENAEVCRCRGIRKQLGMKEI